MPPPASLCRRQKCACRQVAIASSREAQALCYFAGANSIFYGDKLLTASNPLRTRTGISCELSIFNRNLLLLTARNLYENRHWLGPRWIQLQTTHHRIPQGKGTEVVDLGPTVPIRPTTPCGLFQRPKLSPKVKQSGASFWVDRQWRGYRGEQGEGHSLRLCWSDETAALSRQHNNANVLSLGERMISIEMALRIVDIWLTSSFEGGRHAGRIEQLARYEAGQPMR